MGICFNNKNYIYCNSNIGENNNNFIVLNLNKNDEQNNKNNKYNNLENQIRINKTFFPKGHIELNSNQNLYNQNEISSNPIHCKIKSKYVSHIKKPITKDNKLNNIKKKYNTRNDYCENLIYFTNFNNNISDTTNSIIK